MGLSRLRDTDRRRRHDERDLHTASVRMPKEAWQQFAQAAKRLGTNTIASTLA
jgi:hypothetical protein